MGLTAKRRGIGRASLRRGSRLLGMTPRPELVSGAEIARRLNVSRECVRQWAASPKLGFPAPVARVGAPWCGSGLLSLVGPSNVRRLQTRPRKQMDLTRVNPSPCQGRVRVQA